MPTKRCLLYDVTTDKTADVQSLIDNTGPGLVLTFAPGQHRIGALRLRSDMTVEIADGAELAFEAGYDSYASNTVAVTAEQSNCAMIYAAGAARITIKGDGMMRGDGVATYTRGKDARMGTLVPAERRPRMVVLDRCRDVKVSGLHIADAPMWTIHAIDCQDLSFSDLQIDNDLEMPNTDGIVIDACRNVTVERCTIRTADDGIVLKTSRRDDGRPTGACAEVTVRDCTVQSRSCALKIGTESHGPFADISFERIRIEGTNRGMGIMSRDGGSIDRVQFRHIHVDCAETPAGFWGAGEALTINTLDRNPGTGPAGDIRNVQIFDITGKMQGAINVVCDGAAQITGITLVQIALEQTQGTFGTGQSYDLRPTALDQLPCDDAHGRTNAWRFDDTGAVVGLHPYPNGLPGVFARGTGLALTDVQITRPNPLPAGWGPVRDLP